MWVAGDWWESKSYHKGERLTLWPLGQPIILYSSFSSIQFLLEQNDALFQLKRIQTIYFKDMITTILRAMTVFLYNKSLSQHLQRLLTNAFRRQIFIQPQEGCSYVFVIDSTKSLSSWCSKAYKKLKLSY